MAAVSEGVADPAAVAADSARQESTRIDLLGAPLDLLSQREVERAIARRLVASQGTLLHVATLNPEYVIHARDSGAFRTALGRAEISVADGVGVAAAARLLYGHVAERVTGVDLADWLLTGARGTAPRVFLLGSPGSVSALHGRFPTCVVGRWGSGTASSRDDADSVARIAEREADVVLVGYGAPGQVLWIERNRSALEAHGVKIAIGVGGALDYLSGDVPRAPGILRRAGLEWAYRLGREPWRWRRQLALPRFAALTASAWMRNRRVADGGACRILSSDESSCPDAET